MSINLKVKSRIMNDAEVKKENGVGSRQPTLKINGKSLTPKCHYISFAKSYFLLLTSAKFGVRSGLSTLI